MKKAFRALQNYILRKPELDIILFKILGAGGIAVSIITGIYSLTQAAFVSALADFGAAIFSVFLLYFVEKTGKYIIGYIITEVGVFMGVFTVLFFSNGGIDGALPFFFSFAIIFTFLMFQDVLLVVMETLLTAYYIFICVLTYLRPELLWHTVDSSRRLSELLVGIFFSALPMGFIILFYISAYKKQKKIADDANLAKGVFLANMSHELRTPINAVLGFDEIIIKNSNEEQTREYANHIRNSGRQLLDVINQVLDFSRLEAGKESVICENYNPDILVEELKVYGKSEAARKGLAFNVEYEKNDCGFLYGDRVKVHRIALNLLSNAVKYTTEGTVTLRVKCTAQGEKYLLNIAVEDTGVGIEKEDLNNLFRSYERMDLLKNQKIQGTGLGLAISKHLAQLIDGDIKVESTYGVGSTFTLEVPQNNGREQIAEVNDNKNVYFLAPDAKVLVVDDNNLNRILLNAMLSETLMKVDTASNAQECLEKVQDHDYDIILMDYMMPGMDGAETMEIIRKNETATGKHTPIFVLTADVVEHIDKKLIDRGFDSYISKPIDYEQLKKRIIEHLPADKVEISESDVSYQLSREKISEYIKDLSPYDIHIADGLRYVGNNAKQFVTVAKLYIKNSENSQALVDTAVKMVDEESMRLLFHSLKGNSKSVGANELNELARRMEGKCKQGDIEYINSAIKLLMFEWNRSIEGLKKFLELAEERNPELFVDPGDIVKTMTAKAEAGSENSDGGYTDEELEKYIKSLMDDIYRDIDMYQSKVGVEHICELRKAVDMANEEMLSRIFIDVSTIDKALTFIEKALENMEYEVAEKLFLEIGVEDE